MEFITKDDLHTVFQSKIMVFQCTKTTAHTDLDGMIHIDAVMLDGQTERSTMVDEGIAVFIRPVPCIGMRIKVYKRNFTKLSF